MSTVEPFNNRFDHKVDLFIYTKGIENAPSTVGQAIFDVCVRVWALVSRVREMNDCVSASVSS